MKKGNFIWLVVLLTFISGTLMAVQSSEEIYLERLKYKTEHEFDSAKNLSDVNNNENLRNYCDSFWTNTTDDWITNVTFNTINNETGQEGAQSYGDYTAISTNVNVGDTYTFSMTWFSEGIWTECGAVWFDWNQDEDFFDAGEYYEVGEGVDATVTIDITIPPDAVSGATRMRVSERYNSYPEPCNESGSSYGETEDYTVVIGGGADPGTIEGTVFLVDGTGNVEDVEVEAGGEIVNPVADGTYSIELYPGTYDVTASLAGYETDVVADVVVTEGNATTGVDLTLTYVPATLDPVVNLAVDTDTGLLTWLAPGSGGVDELIEDFEGGVLPDGWLAIDNDGDGFNWINTIEQGFDFDAYEGDGAMTSASYDNTAGPLTPDNWLITPALSIANGHQLSYWHDAQDASWADEYYYVKVSTSGTDLEDFTDVIWEGVTPGEWAEVVVDLSDYAGQTIYLAWNHTNVTDMFWMKIDYVVVGAAGRVMSVQNTKNHTQTSTNHKILGASGGVLGNAIVNNQNVSSRDLLGYNVYLGSILQGDTTDLEYLLSGLENGVEYTAGVEAVYDEGESEIVEITFTYTGGTDAGDVIVAATELNGNYPNPFNPVTTIGYSIKDAGNVILEVYNLRGQLVKTLVNEVKETGNHTAIWDGTDDSNKAVSSGVYFYKMVSEGNIGRYTSTKKMILLK